jgi:hypothetical protein
MIKTKDTRLPSVRTSSEQVQRLVRAAEILDTKTSDLVRKAIEEKLTKLAKRYPELAKAA